MHCVDENIRVAVRLGVGTKVRSRRSEAGDTNGGAYSQVHCGLDSGLPLTLKTGILNDFPIT